MLMVFFVPSFFVAGLVVPVAEALFSRALAYSLPTTHFILICRGIFLKGLGLTDMVTPALALAGMGGAAQALSLVLFRKKVG